MQDLPEDHIVSTTNRALAEIERDVLFMLVRWAVPGVFPRVDLEGSLRIRVGIRSDGVRVYHLLETITSGGSPLEDQDGRLLVESFDLAQVLRTIHIVAYDALFAGSIELADRMNAGHTTESAQAVWDEHRRDPALRRLFRASIPQAAEHGFDDRYWIRVEEGRINNCATWLSGLQRGLPRLRRPAGGSMSQEAPVTQAAWIEQAARTIATRAHEGQTYAGGSYLELHLTRVVWTLHGALSPEAGIAYVDPTLKSTILAIGYLHDALEQDVPHPIEGELSVALRAEPGVRVDVAQQIAFCVRALTGHGVTRRLRNKSVYDELRAIYRQAYTKNELRTMECLEISLLVKLADRLVNVQTCWEQRDSRLFMYAKEHREFRSVILECGSGSLGPGKEGPLWRSALNLLGQIDRLLGVREPVI